MLDERCSHCYYNMNVALRQLGRLDEALSMSLESLLRLYEVDVTVFLRRAERISEEDKCMKSVRSVDGMVRSVDSMDVSIVLVKWGMKYGPEYVNRLAYGLRKHHNPAIVPKYRVICYTDSTVGIDSTLVECR